MKTLADMTPQERADCVGMWCGYNRHVKGGEPSDFVIMIEDVNEVGRVSCINPGAPKPKAWAPDPWMLTPRFNLPRAWTADGQPPQGDWEDDYTDSDGSTLTTGEDLDLGPHQEVRRWIGDWEEI
nr:MAG TPA: hypothetical protein [Caudoviricetes sp.]